MSDEGLLRASTVGRTPDMKLIVDKEFNVLIDRNHVVADTILAMGHKASKAIGDVLNREDKRWTDLVDVPDKDISILQRAGEALASNEVGSPEWKEAKTKLLGLLDA
ncbi:MAG: hypothetical protein Q7S29_03595 [Candidatus Peribacter sp.]|nr:hypothetical protein [Candidatus Peribacter sp.]